MSVLTRSLLLATTSAVLLVLSQAPFSFLPAGILAPVPLVLLAELGCRCRIRYLAAYVGALIAFGVGCAWLRFTSPVNLVLMMGPESLTFPFVVALLRLGKTRGIKGALNLAVAWTAIEFMRSHGPFNGFPWLLLGYGAVSPLQMAQAADLVGVFGMSFLLAFVGGLVLNAARPGPNRRTAGVLAATLLIATYSYGAWRAPQVLAGTTVGPRVALIQGNVSQALKVHPVPERILQLYQDQTRVAVEAAQRDGAAVDLIVWPETMVPYYFLHDPVEAIPAADPMTLQGIREQERAFLVRELIPNALQPLGCSALVGTITGNGIPPGQPGSDLYNTAVLYDPDGRRLSQYDKSMLVPGGEFIPFRDYLPEWGFEKIRALAGFVPSLTAGAGPKVMTLKPSRSASSATGAAAAEGREWRFAPTICYENCYPGYNLRAVNAGADFLLNISNEGWFKDSVEMDQMQVASRFRAIETRRTLVRATNTGITAIYDAAGRRRAILEDDAGRDREIGGVLIKDVPISLSGSFYRRAGDLIGVAAMLAALVRAARALGRRYLLRRST